MWKSLHAKYPLFLLDFTETWTFSTDFRKNLKYQVSSKSVQCKPSCSMRTDRQTDMTNLIVAVRNFSKEPKNLAPNQFFGDKYRVYDVQFFWNITTEWRMILSNRKDCYFSMWCLSQGSQTPQVSLAIAQPCRFCLPCSNCVARSPVLNEWWAWLILWCYHQNAVQDLYILCRCEAGRRTSVRR